MTRKNRLVQPDVCIPTCKDDITMSCVIRQEEVGKKWKPAPGITVLRSSAKSRSETATTGDAELFSVHAGSEATFQAIKKRQVPANHI